MSISNIQLKKASPSDCIFIWKLRNQFHCRLNSFSLEEISWENHKIWFESKLQDPSCLFYIIEFDEFPVGQIRVDIDDDLTGEVSLSVAEEYRSLGIAQEALKLVFYDLKNRSLIIKMVANVKVQNLKSVILFLRAGFKFKSYTKLKNIEYYTFLKSSL